MTVIRLFVYFLMISKRYKVQVLVIAIRLLNIYAQGRVMFERIFF